MKTSNVLIGVLVVVMLISLACIWTTTSVQDFMPGNNIWNGMSDFADDVNATNVDSLDVLPESPQGNCLMSIPYVPYDDMDLSGIKDFVLQGGHLVLMDDLGYGNDVLEYLDVDARFSTAHLLDFSFYYRNPRLPRITDFSVGVREAGVSVVVLNHAVGLSGVDESQVLAWSSERSFLDYDDSGEWSSGEMQGPFPVAARMRLGKGMVTLISDPSIMINSMRTRDDNGAFIQYLVAPDGVGEGEILVDRAHLTKNVLDRTQTGLASIREIFDMPYPLMGLVAIIFVVVSRYTLRKEELLG